MELFHKIYSCYYNVIRHILTESWGHPLTRQRMEELCRIYGFEESGLTILSKLTDGTWPLIEAADRNTYVSCLHHAPCALPLTDLQKSWLKAILRDRRARLFFSDKDMEILNRELKGCDPLYDNRDFYYYDRYRDADPYHDPEYREHFQSVLQAFRDSRALLVAYEGKHGHVHPFEAAPYQLQYSSRDDKFRLCCLQFYHGRFCRNTILNLSRIKHCHVTTTSCPPNLDSFRFCPVRKASEPVLLEISGERNSLERCMLHFANYEKHTEYDEEKGCWLCRICYDLADETELLIDILSFGPVVRVLSPQSFVRQIRNRVKRQHELFYGPLNRSLNDTADS